MTCITSDQLTDLQTDLAAVLAQISAIDAAMLAYTLTGTKSYVFDSGTGRQQETFSSPLELKKTRDQLAATRNYLRNALAGKTIIRQKLRRI